MRIARIIEYFPFHVGGMERHGLILSQEQIKLGYFVDVFIGYGNSRPNLGSSLRSDLADFKIYKAPFQFLPMYSKIRRFWFNFWAMWQVAKQHKKTPYDIIHLHGDFMEAHFGGKLSEKIKIPAVLTIHAGLNKRLLKPKNADYFKNIAKIICVSNEIAENLENIGVPENKLKVISSGIYLSEFQNIDESKITALRNQYSKPIIVSVGVLRINKGFRYLIDAFEMTKEKLNNTTLLIIGDGPLKNELEAQVRNIGGIYFLGQQNHDKVTEYLKVADIFVLASISTDSDREGTSTAIMEAMAAGLPVVATRVGGNSYLLKEGINGFLVEDKNSDELAEAVIKLINNPGIREKMKIKNLEDIKQKDWSVIVEKINEIYKSILY